MILLGAHIGCTQEEGEKGNLAIRVLLSWETPVFIAKFMGVLVWMDHLLWMDGSRDDILQSRKELHVCVRMITSIC
jgi:hypothetical protein